MLQKQIKQLKRIRSQTAKMFLGLHPNDLKFRRQFVSMECVDKDTIPYLLDETLDEGRCGAHCQLRLV